jgi:hypothetical protein
VPYASLPCKASHVWSPSVCSYLYIVSYDALCDWWSHQLWNSCCYPLSSHMSAVEIHHELCVAVYGQNVKSEGAVRQWCRVFKDGRMDKHMFTMKSEVVGHLSHMMHDLVQRVDQKICWRPFTFSELSYEFPQFSWTVLYNIITVRLRCHKFCTRRVPKLLTGAHKMQRMALAFLERYHKDDAESLNHIIWVRGDEAWVSLWLLKQKAVKAVDAHTHYQTSQKSLNWHLPKTRW